MSPEKHTYTPCMSFWLFLFQQSQLITAYCCRQLETATNLEFHYRKLFHMCIRGTGGLEWPRLRKERGREAPAPSQPATATGPCYPLLSPFYPVFLFSIHAPLSLWVCFSSSLVSKGLPDLISFFFSSSDEERSLTPYFFFSPMSPHPRPRLLIQRLAWPHRTFPYVTDIIWKSAPDESTHGPKFHTGASEPRSVLWQNKCVSLHGSQIQGEESQSQGPIHSHYTIITNRQ